MVIRTDMVYNRLDFSFRSPLEIQVTGFWSHVAQEGTGAFPDWADIMQPLANRLVGAWSAEVSGTLFGIGVRGVRAVCYHYSQDLKTVLNRSEAGFVGPTEWFGQGGASLPPQCSVVTSLYAYPPDQYVPMRDSKRGRMYLPTPSDQVLGNNGDLKTATRDEYLSDMVNFFGAYSAALDVPNTGPLVQVRARPVVISKRRSIDTEVEVLRVGSVIDTQRRRRNNMTESYATLPLA